MATSEESIIGPIDPRRLSQVGDMSELFDGEKIIVEK
jgi:hypothetical protein